MNPRSKLPRTWRVRVDGVGGAEEVRRRLLEVVRFALGGEDPAAPGREPPGSRSRVRAAGLGSRGTGSEGAGDAR